MLTRSKSAKCDSINRFSPSKSSKPKVGEENQVTTSHGSENGSKRKDTSKKSTTTKASSIRRRELEAQIKADEEMAQLLAKEEEILAKRKELNQRMVTNRLELEKVNENGSYLENSQGCSGISTVNSFKKVSSWLNAHEIHKSDPTETIANNFNNLDPTGDIQHLLARQSIDKDLPIFTGNVREWPSFYCQYLSSTKLLRLSDEENLCRLRKCLKGDARRAVEGLLLSCSAISPIIEILTRKFGRPDLIVRSLVQDAKNLPIVRNGDFRSLTHFSETIANLVITLEIMDMKNYLNCPQLLEEMLKKLPYNVQLAWGEQLVKSEGKCSLPEFQTWIWRRTEAASYTQDFTTATRPTFSKEKYKNTLMTRKTNEWTKMETCKFCSKSHTIENCNDFLMLTVDDKWKFIKEKRVCFSCLKGSHLIGKCTKKQKCGTNGCEKFHHKILHNENYRKSTGNEVSTEQIVKVDQETQVVAHTSRECTNEVLLRIAPITIKSQHRVMSIFALFDEASTVSLLDEDVANELGIEGDETTLALRWTDDSTEKRLISRKIGFEIAGENNIFYKLENVYTMKDMDLPIQSNNTKNFQNKWSHLKKVSFPSYREAQPKLLIGQDYWDLITSREIIEGPRNAPALSRTKLGWIVHGNLQLYRHRIDNNVVLHIRHGFEYDELHEEVKKYFSSECFGVKTPDKEILSKEDERAEEIMRNVTRRIGNRLETGLLWKNEDTVLPESKTVAIQRLQYLERRMKKDEEFAEEYSKKIDEYQSKGYAKLTPDEEVEEQTERNWYLPHFGVVNENKPGKLRFVFDAASKAEGKSLNDFLLKGPDLYNSLVGIIWKFREKYFAFSADVSEMFHQIHIRKEDQSAQRFLWRNEETRNLETYTMQVMIFGAICSPFSAQYVKNQNALEYQQECPRAVTGIIKRHYMDDYLDSVDTRDEAKKLIQEVIMIHEKGGFKLRNWITNDEEIFLSIPSDLRSSEKIFGNEGESQRILGMVWNPKKDILAFSMKFHKLNKDLLMGRKIPTKREMLKIVMSIFDPLGLLGYFTIRAKILLQDVWRRKLDWDEEISDEIYNKWKILVECFELVEKLEVPRCYNLNNWKGAANELHLFCDGSEQAICTVAYWRISKGNEVHVSLVMARTQVAPLLPTSIPRMELQAAVIASRLAKTIITEHTLEVSKKYFWTDSKTILHWLRSEARNYKTYVAHRVGEIQESTHIDEWNWVPTNLNVADEGTRNTKSIDLSNGSRWFRGPEFLYLSKENWPKEEKISKESIDNLELRTHRTLLGVGKEVCTYLSNVSHFSSWTKLIRSTAYVYKFVMYVKAKKNGETIPTGNLKVEELQEAEKLWCMEVQKRHFGKEILDLENKRKLEKTSKLFQLSPTIENGLIRMKGRTDYSPELEGETKHPIILEKHPYTSLFVEHYHVKFNHAGLQLVLNELRQKFWIIGARRLITKILRNCNFCKIKKAKPTNPEMGQIPRDRLTKPLRPFTFVGMDFFGPLSVSIGRRKEKRYGVLFTCLSIRAIHIELAESLSTDSAILAIRRFFARRGQPSTIWSDNGTNLKSADKELRQQLKEIDTDTIEKEFLSQEITWKFIPPASPNMGGVWERMIRSVKNSLKIILKEKSPRPEVLQTVLLEAEHIVNSRPLTYVSSSGEDPESLTPNHFLIGTSSIVKTPGVFEPKVCLRKQWQTSQQLADQFWKRWVREYLPTLTKRTKWFQERKNLQENDLVIIMDERMPRNNWLLGRIVAVYPGKDNIVRIVDVKTKCGTYRRPVNKLCHIDLLEESNLS